MILGIGVDLVDIEQFRIDIVSDEKARTRTFTAEEIGYCSSQPNPYRNFAGTFAAKEALAKALGTGWTDEVDWLDVMILRSDTGVPHAVLQRGARTAAEAIGVTKVFISITHDGAYAVAAAALES